jgi:hypothetical protein
VGSPAVGVARGAVAIGNRTMGAGASGGGELVGPTFIAMISGKGLW